MIDKDVVADVTEELSDGERGRIDNLLSRFGLVEFVYRSHSFPRACFLLPVNLSVWLASKYVSCK